MTSSPDLELPCGEPPTRLARRLCVAAMFGLNLHSSPRPSMRRAAHGASRALLDALPTGVAIISGPSGGGKSTILSALQRDLRRRSSPLIVVPSPVSLAHQWRCPLDFLHSTLHADLTLLADLGLAEAPLWIRPARALSEGQRARLALAIAFDAARAVAAPTIIADEFTSSLDRVTAMTLCLALGRLVAERPGLRVVVATAHEDVALWLEHALRLRVAPGFIHHGGFQLEKDRARQ